MGFEGSGSGQGDFGILDLMVSGVYIGVWGLGGGGLGSEDLS